MTREHDAIENEEWPDRTVRPLAFARRAQRELSASMRQEVTGTRRDRLVRAFDLGITGRRLAEYLRLLELPLVLQLAVERGALSMHAALKYFQLSPVRRAELDAALREGNAADVLREAVQNRGRWTDSEESRRLRYRGLIERLHASLDDLGPHLPQVAGHAGPTRSVLRTLAEFERFVREAARCERQAARRGEAAWKRLLQQDP